MSFTNKNGVEGLKYKPKSSRKPKLSPDQLEALRNTVINKSPEEYGYNTSVWIAPLLVEWVKKKFNVIYSDNDIYIILKKKLNLRHKKGKGFYLEADRPVRVSLLRTGC